jgi:hypothetical protein
VAIFANIQPLAFVLPSAVLKSNICNSENCRFSCDFVWMWNLLTDINGGTQTEGKWEKSAGENT